MELGLGAVAVSPRPYVDERWLQSGQFWFTAKTGSWLQLSAISAFDAEALAIGGGATAVLIRKDRFAGGFEAELGYGWGAAGLPFAVRLFEQHWIYSTPRVSNFGIDPSFGVPVGLSLHLHEGGFLRLEYQTSWAPLNAYNQRNHLGAALVAQW
jgi:hypothetical protein